MEVNGYRNYFLANVFPLTSIFKKMALLWMSVVTATVPQHCFNDFHSICPPFYPKSVSSNSSKYILCSTEERNSYRFGTVAAFHKTIGYGRAGMVIYKIYKKSHCTLKYMGGGGGVSNWTLHRESWYCGFIRHLHLTLGYVNKLKWS